VENLVSADPTGILKLVQIERVPFAIVAIVVAIVVANVVTRVLDDVGGRFRGWRIPLKQASAVLRFVILVGTAILVVTAIIQFTNETMLAIGGSIAVAVGFAVKDLLASLLAGLIVLFDRPFQVGDRVRVGEWYGEVKDIGLRTTRIVTLDDNLISIPNNVFLTDMVASANAGALDQMCVFRFLLATDQDLATAKRIVYEATVTSRFAYLRKPVLVNVKEAPVEGMDAVIAFHITCKAYVMDGRFEIAFATDVHERVKRAFVEAGIQTAGDRLWAGGGDG
jgi:small-conductance mechanosensitive channel